MFKIIKKADVLLFLVLILIGLALSWFAMKDSVTGEKVRVSVDGKSYGTYSLAKDQTVTIRENGHTNKFSIKDGKVQMTYASCKNQVCIHKGAINQTSQSIVCLPNRVVIEIEGGGYDAVSK